MQNLFESIVTAVKNGGKRVPIATQLGYTKEQIDTIQRLKNGKTDAERMGLYPGASKYGYNYISTVYTMAYLYVVYSNVM